MEQKIFNIVKKHFPNYKGTINGKTRLKEDLNVDCIDFADLVLSIEVETGFYIASTNEEFDSIKTIQDILNIIKKKTEVIYGK